MKTRIGLLVIAFMLMMGTVSAASLHGDYDGNPIIKMKSNGVELIVTDVPAMTYKHRTMVPVYMLQQLGVDVKWDQKTRTVDVSLPKVGANNQTTPSGFSHYNNSADDLKFYSKVSYEFHQLMNLGDMITSLSSGYRLALRTTGFDHGWYKKMNAKFRDIIDMYNERIKINEEITNELWRKGIYDGSLSEINKQYFKALEYYNKADSNMDHYSQNSSSIDLEKHYANADLGYDVAFQGMEQALIKFNEYYEKLQNY